MLLMRINLKKIKNYYQHILLMRVGLVFHKLNKKLQEQRVKHVELIKNHMIMMQNIVTVT